MDGYFDLCNSISWEVTKQISPSRQMIDFVNSCRSLAASFSIKSTLMVHFFATNALEVEIVVVVVLTAEGIRKSVSVVTRAS